MTWLQVPALGNARSWDEAVTDPRCVGEAADALRFFRRILGEDWRGWAASFPLAARFLVAFQDGPPEGVRLHQMLHRLDGVPNRDLLIRKDIGSGTWREYGAAIMAVEFCSHICDSGGDVTFVQNTDEASPDVRARFVERWVTVEFKALHDHDEMATWESWYQCVYDGLCARNLGALSFDVDLEEGALAEPDAVVDGLAEVAAKEHRDYALLPRLTGRARLAAINCGEWRYPVSQKDELSRIRSNLMNKWCRQLARTSGPRLLVVRTNTVFGASFAAFPGDARRVAEAVGPVLRQKPMLSAVLAYEEPFAAPLPPIEERHEDFWAHRSATPHGSGRFAVLLRNSNARDPLSEPELARAIGVGCA